MRRLVVITGVTSGIGLKVAEVFHKAGYEIHGIARNPEKLRTLTFLETFEVCDFSEERAWEGCLEKILVDGFDKVFLINNAGTLDPIVFQEHLQFEDLKQAMNVNFYAPLFLAQKFYQILKRHPAADRVARILNISTGAAFHGYEGWTAYCATKAAFWIATETFGKEIDSNICQIAALAPGVVETNMQVHIRNQKKEQFPLVDEFKKMKSEGRLYETSVPANFILKLLEKADYPHGQHLDLRKDQV